jgi:hypothetical protein
MTANAPRRFLKGGRRLAFILILFAAELLCAWAAYETIGETVCSLYCLAIVVGNAVILLISFTSRSVATVIAVILAAGIIPYQLVLVQRLVRVRAEAARIAAYAFDGKARTGQYPLDLSGYTFKDEYSRKYIQEYWASEEKDDFQVTFCVGTESTSHWYSPKDGWCYYPD